MCKDNLPRIVLGVEKLKDYDDRIDELPIIVEEVGEELQSYGKYEQLDTRK